MDDIQRELTYSDKDTVDGSTAVYSRTVCDLRENGRNLNRGVPVWNIFSLDTDLPANATLKLTVRQAADATDEAKQIASSGNRPVTGGDAYDTTNLMATTGNDAVAITEIGSVTFPAGSKRGDQRWLPFQDFGVRFTEVEYLGTGLGASEIDVTAYVSPAIPGSDTNQFTEAVGYGSISTTPVSNPNG